MELTLCRHGESDGNAASLCQGWTPGFLTARGRKQAVALGSTLFPSSEAIAEYDAIFCSDLTRVVETATIALGASKSRYSMADAIISPLLREKNAGILEGKPKSMAVNARAKSTDERNWKPKSGESWNDLQLRVQEFMHALAQSGYRKVLVFTSGGVIAESSPRLQHIDDMGLESKTDGITSASSYESASMMKEGVFDMIVENRRPIFASSTSGIVDTITTAASLSSSSSSSATANVASSGSAIPKSFAKSVTSDDAAKSKKNRNFRKLNQKTGKAQLVTT